MSKWPLRLAIFPYKPLGIKNGLNTAGVIECYSNTCIQKKKDTVLYGICMGLYNKTVLLSGELRHFLCQVSVQSFNISVVFLLHQSHDANNKDSSSYLSSFSVHVHHVKMFSEIAGCLSPTFFLKSPFVSTIIQNNFSLKLRGRASYEVQWCTSEVCFSLLYFSFNFCLMSIA